MIATEHGVAIAELGASAVLYGEVVDDMREPDEGPRYVACFVHTFFSRACWLANGARELPSGATIGNAFADGCRVVDAWLVSRAIAPRLRRI